MHGPFTVESLKAALETGDVTLEDLVQVGGLPIWRPLRQVLESPLPEIPGIVPANNVPGPVTPPPLSKSIEAPPIPAAGAEEEEPVESIAVNDLKPLSPPDWMDLGQLIWDRLRIDFEYRPVGTGLICLGLGVVACLAAFWPFLFWLPWFGLAFFAGFDALKRGKTAQGVGLLVAACAVPILLSTIISFVRHRSAEPSEMPFNGAAETAAPVNSPTARQPDSRAPVNDATRSSQPAVPVVIESVRSQAPKPEAPRVREGTPTAPTTPTPSASPATPPPTRQNTIPVKPLSAIDDMPLAAAPPETLAADTSIPAPAAPALNSTTPTSPIAGGEFVQMHRNSFVVVKDGSSSGSGFICRDGQKTYLYTNAHVAAGMRNPQFSRLDGSQIRVSSVEAGGPRDVVRFGVTDAALSLDILPNLDASVRIGDEVVVLGNSGGGGVVTALNGKLVGIGPDRIEVSAEFIPGNSGSPIIHVPTGKVIGIATYLTKRHEEFAGSSTGVLDKDGATVRRFGFRLDQVERWEPVNWAAFHGEAEQLRQIAALTADIFNFIDALQAKKEPEFETAALRRPATDWLANIRRPKVSEADRNRSTQAFLSALRFMVRSDVTAAESRLRYSYFRERLRKEREVRDRLYKSFDDEVKKMSSPSMR